MADILPPPPTKPTEAEPPTPKSGGSTNELTVLAEFIRENAGAPFDLHLSALLEECGDQHDLFAGNCKVPHWHDEFPCDEYERSVSLGIAWLKARIQQEAHHAS